MIHIKRQIGGINLQTDTEGLDRRYKSNEIKSNLYDCVALNFIAFLTIKHRQTLHMIIF